MQHSHSNTGFRNVFDFVMSSALRQSEESRYFQTESGEVCVYLSPCWDELLVELQGLGEIAIVSHNSHCSVAQIVPGLEFVQEPSSTRWMELSSGFSADSGDWHFALAVEQHVKTGALLGIQFFDRGGRGQFKLLLTEKKQVDAFLSLIMYYGLDGLPPALVEAEPSSNTPGPVVVPDKQLLEKLWPLTRHETGRMFFPGLPGVKRLMALQCAGEDRARRITFEEFISAIMFARRGEIPLDCHLFNGRLTQKVKLTPVRVERCNCGLHIFDTMGEFHVRPGKKLTFWAIRTGEKTALELIDTDGERVALVENAGCAIQQRMWASSLFR